MEQISEADGVGAGIGAGMSAGIAAGVAADIAAGVAAARGIATLDLGVLSDGDLATAVVGIEQLGRLVDTLRTRGASEVAVRSRRELGIDGLARQHGHACPEHLLEQWTRISQAEATRRIRLGAAIRPARRVDGTPVPPRYPAVADALADGAIATETASTIVRCLDAAMDASPHDIACAEAALVDAALDHSADLVATQARVWRERLDPDGAAPREEELRHRRGISLGRERGGMTRILGWADPISAGMLRAVFDAGNDPRATPRFLSAEDAERGATSTPTPDGTIVTTIVDPRTREQRQFDTLLGVLTAGLRSTEQSSTTGVPSGMRSISAVSVVVGLRDLERGAGAAWIDGVDEPISMATVRQLMCDAGFSLVVEGDDGEVLALGRSERFFTPAQRRALAVRDGGCVWPQCQDPPGWCEAHHVIEYEKGGPTDIDNGAMLCSAHHHLLHASDFEMRMIRGRPHLLAPPRLDAAQQWNLMGRPRSTGTG
ncbi:HNH endonuclease signature motif containing protein [Marisediminicola senii]|uniref:HNH endonuclease signature motif containing protein n=1 Tax=Marisediminicola senii TaxID=2711233 RepID=UPI0013EDD16C|nr:HNH endonuclease signature motif containing protein [Marisediminicola senii]